MPIDQEELIEQLGSMTPMEMVALTRELEDRWGVSATPQHIPQEIGVTLPDPEDQTEFDVILGSYGENKINVIKTLRPLLGLGLKETKEMVEAAPVTIKELISKEEAEEIKTKLEEAGGTVTIK